MKRPGTELHLALDESLLGHVNSGAGAAAAPSVPPVLETLRVPAGVSYLRRGAGLGKMLTDTVSDGSSVIEPLTDGPQPRLVLLTPPGVDAPTVNGRLAPRVCLLRVGDQWLLDDGRLLHVTAFDTPRIGPPTDLEAGALCPVCRTPFNRDGRTFTCPCGQMLHYDDDDVPEDKRLLCAALASECATCRSPINLEGGFRHVPSLD